MRNTGTLVSLKPALSHRRLLEAIEVRDPIAARAVAREIMARSQQSWIGLYALGVPAGDEARLTG